MIYRNSESPCQGKNSGGSSVYSAPTLQGRVTGVFGKGAKRQGGKWDTPDGVRAGRGGLRGRGAGETDPQGRDTETKDFGSENPGWRSARPVRSSNRASPRSAPRSASTGKPLRLACGISSCRRAPRSQRRLPGSSYDRKRVRP